MYPRLLEIGAVVFGFGLSEALPAGDVWKGSWKFELDPLAFVYFEDPRVSLGNGSVAAAGL
jgi:hypothetical protein